MTVLHDITENQDISTAGYKSNYQKNLCVAAGYIKTSLCVVMIPIVCYSIFWIFVFARYVNFSVKRQYLVRNNHFIIFSPFRWIFSVTIATFTFLLLENIQENSFNYFCF